MSSALGPVVMAWVGETLTGHGTAVCTDCGWFYSNKTYGTVALRVLDHQKCHAPV